MADGDKKKSFLKLIIIISVILIVDIVGGYFIGVKVIVPMFYEDETAETKKAAEDKGGKKEGGTAAPGIEKALEAINLNPANSIGEIFSCNIVLVADAQPIIDEITARNFEIMDKLYGYLSFKTVQELNDPKNWEGYRKDMIELVNSSLKSGEITALYIPQRIIQFE